MGPGGWLLDATVTHNSLRDGDRFGENLIIDKKGNRLAVAAPGAFEGRGAIFMFTRASSMESFEFDEARVCARRDMARRAHGASMGDKSSFRAPYAVHGALSLFVASLDRSVCFVWRVVIIC